jgi:hypothetical protein
MRIIPTGKYSGGTLSKKGRFRSLLRNQRGQGFLEYILVLMVVLGTIFVLARPVMARLQKKFEKGMKGGIFKADPSGSNFYYFPVK